MLQQPLARRVAGAARYAAAGEALPGALPLSSMRRRARACELRRLLEVQQMDGRLDGARGPDGARLRDIYQSGDYDCTALSLYPPPYLTRTF